MAGPEHPQAIEVPPGKAAANPRHWRAQSRTPGRARWKPGRQQRLPRRRASRSRHLLRCFQRLRVPPVPPGARRPAALAAV